MKWRCNQGDPSGVKSSFSLCSRNISRNSFSAQLRASCQPARCPKPPLGGNAFLGGWLVLSFTDFLAVAEVSLWVGKIGSCTNNFSVVPDELKCFPRKLWFPLLRLQFTHFAKRQKPESFLSSPSTPFLQILSEGQKLSPISWWRSFSAFLEQGTVRWPKSPKGSTNRENRQSSSSSLVWWGAPGTQLTLGLQNFGWNLGLVS